MKLHDPIDGLGPRGAKPRLNPLAKLAEAKLTPTEGFVLSRVDGHTSYGDICNLTGLGAAATVDILKRLLAEGFILNPGEEPRPQPSPAPVARASVPSPRPPADSGVLARLDDGSPVDPSDLLDGPDLDDLLKKRLIRAARRLSEVSAHELLGVAADADHKAIKKAYFLASKELHPDRFYGKNLGTFRPLIERLFRAASQAFESLEKTRG